MSRRRLLALGGAAAGSALLGPAAVSAVTSTGAGASLLPFSSRAVRPALDDHRKQGPFPQKEIEKIVGAEGQLQNGVLVIEVDRTDLPHVKKDGYPILPSFEINGDLCFQRLGDGSFVLNADLAFLPDETNPAIDQMYKHGIVFQAFHQHLFNLSPMVWFMHFRGRGSAKHLAEACRAILSVTRTPLPQTMPKNPKTPLDTKRLARIIGATPSVGEDGVVSFEVPKKQRVKLGGIEVSPYLNIFTMVDFEPLGGDRAIVVPDFAQTAAEVHPCATIMRAQGWQINCLYNQEIGEEPQLYFSHDFKVGNAYELAKEVRRGLEAVHSKFE